MLTELILANARANTSRSAIMRRCRNHADSGSSGARRVPSRTGNKLECSKPWQERVKRATTKKMM